VNNIHVCIENNFALPIYFLHRMVILVVHKQTEERNMLSGIRDFDAIFTTAPVKNCTGECCENCIKWNGPDIECPDRKLSIVDDGDSVIIYCDSFVPDLRHLGFS